MAWSIDARIPVTILRDAAALPGTLAGRPAALLSDNAPPATTQAVAHATFDPMPAHAAGCACCAGRSGAALAFDRLFQARVRGAAAWFDRVVVLAGSDAASEEIRRALDADSLTRARFRPG